VRGIETCWRTYRQWLSHKINLIISLIKFTLQILIQTHVEFYRNRCMILKHADGQTDRRWLHHKINLINEIHTTNFDTNSHCILSKPVRDTETCWRTDSDFAIIRLFCCYLLQMTYKNVKLSTRFSSQVLCRSGFKIMLLILNYLLNILR
jgi:hypothetical protein